ncbi:MAG TPA: peptidylprolyl isomerase [Caulobacteraceae bacterium]|nr:peptidylprolyl isomerase [Caulobacteraceae bacterium]
MALSFAVGASAQSAAPDPAPSTTVSQAAAEQASLKEGVVAVVNDSAISSWDLQQRIRLIIVTSGVKPTDQNIGQIEQEALNELINERLEIQEVRKAEKDQKFKIMADDSDIDNEINRMADQSSHMTGPQLMAALANSGVGAQTLRDKIRADISWQRWMHGRYGGSRLKVSNEQINAVIKQIEDQASKPQYWIGEIFIDASRVGGMQAAENGAEQLITQMQQGAPFNTVARQFSAAPTAANGGDTGWITQADMRPEVRAAAEQLHPGELSKPIPVEGGVYIIALRDKHEGSTSSLVSLKQAAIALPADAPAADVQTAEAKLIALKSKIKGCDDLESKADAMQGVSAADLGEADVKDLKPAFQQAAATLAVNHLSDPIRTDVGLHIIAVCSRRQAGVNMPTREEIQEHLQEDNLSLIAKRYLRDLKNSATIEIL